MLLQYLDSEGKQNMYYTMKEEQEICLLFDMDWLGLAYCFESENMNDGIP